MAEILPAVPFCHKCIVKGTKAGLPFVNSFYVQSSQATFDQTAMTAVAAAVRAAYWSAFASVLTTSTAHVSTTVIQLSSTTLPFGIDTGAAAGTKAGSDVLPANVACCISEVILDRYRGGHPRFYLPAALLSDITAGRNWVAGSLTAYTTAAAAFRTGINAMTAGGSSWSLVAVRYHSQKVLLTTPLVRPVTATIVHNRIDSMRRRTGKEVA